MLQSGRMNTVNGKLDGNSDRVPKIMNNLIRTQ